METDTMEKEVHLGENIRSIRGVLRMPQGVLADKIGMAQSHLSNYEKSAKIDDTILDQVAAGLGVSAEFIKQYDHEATVNFIISDSTFNEGSSINGRGDNPYTTNNINPLDKLIEVYDARVKELKEEIAELKAEVKELRKR